MKLKQPKLSQSLLPNLFFIVVNQKSVDILLPHYEAMFIVSYQKKVKAASIYWVLM